MSRRDWAWAVAHGIFYGVLVTFAARGVICYFTTEPSGGEHPCDFRCDVDPATCPEDERDG